MNQEEMRQKLGNVSQIRELLFGEQMNEYNRQFSHSQEKIQQIESSIEDLSLNLERFKSDIQEHLTQLKSNLTDELNTAVDSLDKKLKYLSINTYNEIQKTKQEIKIQTETNSQKIDLGLDKLQGYIQVLKQEAQREKKTLNQDIANLKNQLSESIDKNLAELSEAKVSRSDMAEILFELCLKFKGEEPKQPFLEPQIYSGAEEMTEELILLEENTAHE